MSPWPQAPGSASLLTKNRPFLPTGVGQKSSAAELTGSPTLTGAPHGRDVLARVAPQMSSPPFPPGRFEAMYRLSPSGDWIGQPSSDEVFSSVLFPPISSIFCAPPQAESATAAPARLTAAAIPSVVRSFAFMSPPLRMHRL